MRRRPRRLRHYPVRRAPSRRRLRGLDSCRGGELMDGADQEHGGGASRPLASDAGGEDGDFARPAHARTHGDQSRDRMERGRAPHVRRRHAVEQRRPLRPRRGVHRHPARPVERDAVLLQGPVLSDRRHAIVVEAGDAGAAGNIHRQPQPARPRHGGQGRRLVVFGFRQGGRDHAGRDGQPAALHRRDGKQGGEPRPQGALRVQSVHRVRRTRWRMRGRARRGSWSPTDRKPTCARSCSAPRRP